MYYRALLIITVASSVGSAYAGPDGDFRGFDWGDAMEYVRVNERAELHEVGEDYLAYWDTFAGHDALVVYYFDPEFGLTGGDYGLAEAYADPEEYIDAFDDFGDALTAEYGKGDLLVEWRDRSLEPQYEGKLGKALAEGQVKFKPSWITDRTSVYILARNETGKLEDTLVTVHYYSTEYLEREKDEETTSPTIHKKKL